MSLDPISAGISAGAGLVGNIVNAISAKRTQERQFNYNMQLQQQQQAYETDMWNKANEYNSPVHQMARLSEAGLNPNMVYGQSSSQAAGSASVPQGAANSVGSLQPVHLDLSQVAMAAAQVNTQVQTSKLLQRQQDAASAAMQKDLAEAAYKLAQTPGAQATSRQLTEFANRYSEVLQLQLDNASQDIRLKSSLENVYKWQQQDLQYKVENLNPAQRDLVFQQINESIARINQKWQELTIQSRFASASERSAAASEKQAQAALQNANTNALVGAAEQNQLNAQENLFDKEALLNEAKAQEQRIKNIYSNAGIHPDVGGLAGNILKTVVSLKAMRQSPYGLNGFPNGTNSW